MVVWALKYSYWQIQYGKQNIMGLVISPYHFKLCTLPDLQVSTQKAQGSKASLLWFWQMSISLKWELSLHPMASPCVHSFPLLQLFSSSYHTFFFFKLNYSSFHHLKKQYIFLVLSSFCLCLQLLWSSNLEFERAMIIMQLIKKNSVYVGISWNMKLGSY